MAKLVWLVIAIFVLLMVIMNRGALPNDVVTTNAELRENVRKMETRREMARLEERNMRLRSPDQAPPPPPTPSSTMSYREMLLRPIHPAATCLPSPPRESPRPPTEQGPYDAEYADSMKGETPPFVYSRPVRLALCLNGRSASRDTDVVVGPEEVRRTVSKRWNNLQKYVLEPSKALHPTGDVTWDVFVFTTSPSFVEATREVVRPARIETGESLSWYHSPLHSLWMMWEHADKFNISYDRVLLLRNDVLFFMPIPWTSLNPKLFYVTNWCRAMGTPVPHSPKGLVCFPLSIFKHDSVHEGVPDFLFLGTSADMQLVFGNIIDEVLSCETRPTSSCCTHAVYGGQLMRLYNARKLRMGRMLVHHLDFDLHRSFDEGREDLHRRNLTWIPTDPNVSYVDDMTEWVPRRWSWCTRARSYCRIENYTLTHGFEHW